MKRTIILLTILLIGLQSQAQDIVARKVNEQFQETMRIDKLEQITVSKQPVTSGTPKNLRSQYIVGFQGKNTTTTGAMTYWSNTFTDYDTYITESFFQDGKFYVKDNTGKVFQTGELQQVDTSKLETAIDNNTNRINKNSQAIQTNTQSIDALKNDVSRLNTRMDDMQSQINRLDNKLEKGLATVTALTSLHPNPRHKGRTQISIGTGMYADNVAGAIGIFHWITDRIMLSTGASYGGSDSFAGNVGITIGF